jgi:hypothetical protein
LTIAKISPLGFRMMAEPELASSFLTDFLIATGIEGEFESILAGQNSLTHLSFDPDSQGTYFNPIVHKTLKHEVLRAW